MSRTILFFLPRRLPLEPSDLGTDTVQPIDDVEVVRAALPSVLGDVTWADASRGRATFEGQRLELHVAPGTTLSMRCSLRSDPSALVQRLCDELGWLAFDEEPRCFQPHRAPMRA
ncbi:MAG TPA: hypothetical protein VFO79_07830 [Xanthomonadales bacterium]|nr:hypothetical protein [Xanthomonadales bacterium]